MATKHHSASPQESPRESLHHFCCEPASGDVPLISPSVRSSSGKGAQLSEGLHWRWKTSGQNNWLLSSGTTCLRSQLLWGSDSCFSLFDFRTLAHTPPSLAELRLSQPGELGSARVSVGGLSSFFFFFLQEIQTNKESDLVADLYFLIRSSNPSLPPKI